MKLKNHEEQSLICRLIKISVDFEPGKFTEAEKYQPRTENSL
jgi:hypothetical protein